MYLMKIYISLTLTLTHTYSVFYVIPFNCLSYRYMKMTKEEYVIYNMHNFIFGRGKKF